MTPFKAKVIYNPIHSKSESLVSERMFAGIFMGSVLGVDGRWLSDWFIAVCEDMEICQLSFSTKKVHTSRLKKCSLSFPCTDGLFELFDLLRSHRRASPAGRNLEQDERQNVEETSFEARHMSK